MHRPKYSDPDDDLYHVNSTEQKAFCLMEKNVKPFSFVREIPVALKWLRQ